MSCSSISSPNKLELRAAELRSSHGVSVRALAADLGDIESVSSLQDTLRDIDVDILVCNHSAVASPGRDTDGSLHGERSGQKQAVVP